MEIPIVCLIGAGGENIVFLRGLRIFVLRFIFSSICCVCFLSPLFVFVMSVV